MQVQHEACLIEPSPPSFAEHVDKSLDSYCLLPQLSNSLSPVEQIAVCPLGSSSLLAVHLSANNQIVIIDTRSHQRRDKFPLKAYDKKFSKQSFHVSGLAFSPDGQRLAVGQTDCIIYIYKLALGQLVNSTSSTSSGQTSEPITTAAKTTISGKFASSSPVTCLIWSELGLIFGGQDGKVRLILSFNKPPPPSQVAPTCGDLNSKASSQTQQPPPPPPQSQQSSPKVVTLFAGSKGDATPISLAYKAPVLLVGLSNCTIQVLMIISGSGDEVNNSSDTSQQSDQLMSQLLLAPLAPSSRRNSSSIAPHSQQQQPVAAAPTVLQSHTIEHSCPPVHLNLINLNNHTLAISCSGSDGKLAFYSLKATPGQGGGKLTIVSQLQQTVDVKEDILAADYSHINEILALATKNRLMFVRYDQAPNETGGDSSLSSSSSAAAAAASQCWRLQASTIELRRALLLAGVKWARDGAQLVVGSSSGSLELFRCQWSKQSMNDKLDICHIGRNRIRITDRERNLLATYKSQHDIKRVNLLDGGQSVLVWTSQSLLLAKLAGPQSEITWLVATGGLRRNSQSKVTSSSTSTAGSGCKFLFDLNSDYVIIFHEASRELRLLKLGEDSTRFTVQLPVSSATGESSVIKRRLLSVSQFPPSPPNSGVRKPSLSPNRTPGGGGCGGGGGSKSNSSRHGSAQQQQRQQRNNSLSGLANDAANQLLLEEATRQEESLGQPVDRVPAQNQIERFAYLSSSCQLEVIDLTRTNQSIYSHRHAHPIDWLSFSHTGRLLAFLDSSGQLNLLRIKQQVAMDSLVGEDDQAELNSSSDIASIELTILLGNRAEPADKCQWLPESDSLIAQAGPIIYLWHDLNGDKSSQVVMEKFDSRGYNFLQRAPLLDLSLPGGGVSTDRKYPTIRALRNGGLNPDNNRDFVIELSNGQQIPLDKTRTQFYAKLASGSLDSALELLDKSSSSSGSSTTSYNCLYTKLGWMAIERGQCELAWKIFTKLQYKSLAKHLELCLTATTTDETAEATGGRNTRGLMLAKLRGDWDKFERLLVHDQEEVIATYRRLNKWFRLVDFLGRKQQFRRRDLAERDQIAWLLERGRLRVAADLRAHSSGDLVGALELLLERFNGTPDEAVEFTLRNEQKLSLALRTAFAEGGNADPERRLRELIETGIRDKLVASGKLAKAAEICDKILGDSQRALELHLEAGQYESALLVAVGSHGELSNRVEAIHLQCADDLRNKFLADRWQVSGKRARAAIDHYLKCNRPAHALEMAMVVHSTGRGLEILIEHWDELRKLKEAGELRDKVLAQSSELANRLYAAGDHSGAARALEMAENYARLVKILIEQDELERAFKVSLERLHAGNREATVAKFIELAGSCVSEAQNHDGDLRVKLLLERAERIYLLLGRPQLAIEMHEKLGQYEQMLELIERHQTADQLEASLLQLARSLELAGKLEEAEKYLLRASPGEWTSVVRMYRLAKRWPDAFRVARANCLSEQDPLLVQLAYWWTKSLVLVATPPGGGGGGGKQQTQEQVENCKQARDLLRKLNLFKQVVEFACEAKNFQFALDLCRSAEQSADESPSRARVRRELVLRYATILEQQHKFAEAEKLLIGNGLVELAAKMHLDNDQHAEAIRVIERQLEETNDSGSDATQPEAKERRLQQLLGLLNSTLVECAQRIVGDLSAAANGWRTPPLLLMRSQSHADATVAAAASQEPHAGGPSTWSDKLQMAQQMFLRAQRPELAIEMYQSLGMWQEAIQVAQRFAPRLLEGVERALDQQVQADIEPILRQTTASARGAAWPTELASSSGGDTESVGSSAASADQRGVANQTDGNGMAARPGVHRVSRGSGGSQTSALGAWRQFEFAHRQDDRRGARLHFDKYLSLLIANVESHLTIGHKNNTGDNTGQVARQLRHLDKFLRDCRRNGANQDPTSQEPGSLINSILRQQNTCDKLKSLAELIFMLDSNWCSLDMSCVIHSHATWSSLRNILADCAHLSVSANQLPSERHEEHLLVAHYVTLYVSLVRHLTIDTNKQLERLTIKQVELMANDSQELNALDLLSKVSYSLLRHANLLNLGRVLHLAGLWQLACGHLALARQLWSALLEWHDEVGKASTAGVNGKSFRVGVSSLESTPRLPPPPVLGKLVANLPENFMVFSPPTLARANPDFIGPVRQWLLEILIGTTSGVQQRASDASHELPEWSTQLDAGSLACLACGLPVPAVGALHLSAQVALRQHELDELLNLCGAVQSDGSGISLDQKLRSALEQRQRKNLALQMSAASNGLQLATTRTSSSSSSSCLAAASDQLNEIVDFIIDLSTLGGARNGA